MPHGGDWYRNRIKLDFSVNINPLGIPEGVKSALKGALDLTERYPDPENEALSLAIAKKTGLTAEQIVCGNGASELILAAAHALMPKKVLIPAPSFSGYERAVKAVGSEIIYYHMPEETLEIEESILGCLEEEPDMIFLCNPNNPTGKYISRKLLEEIISECGKRKTVVFLDESFMELSDAPESNSCFKELEKNPYLLILNSFTKSYAIPGVRLGFIAGSRKMAEKIRLHLPEWNLSVSAQEAGLAALKEKESIRAARKLIGEERKFLKGALEELGFEVFDSDVNFLLFKAEDIDLYDKLLKDGILIRDCSDFPGLEKGYFRIAVRKHEDNKQLLAGIKKTVKPRLLPSE